MPFSICLIGCALSMLVRMMSLSTPVSFSNVAAILSKSLSSSNLVPSVSFRYKRKEEIFLKLLSGGGCVIFGARLLHVTDHETRTSRILFLTIDHIFQLTIDPFSHEERESRPQSLFRYKRKAIFLNALGRRLEERKYQPLLVLRIFKIYEFAFGS